MAFLGRRHAERWVISAAVTTLHAVGCSPPSLGTGPGQTAVSSDVDAGEPSHSSDAEASPASITARTGLAGSNAAPSIDRALTGDSSLGVDSASADEPYGDASTPYASAADAFALSTDNVDGGADVASPNDATNDAIDPRPSAFAIDTSHLTLHPSFSPAVHDYYVRCASGENKLTITLSGAARNSITLDLEEDQIAVVEDESSTDSDRYYIRCLPHDFPPITVTAHPDLGTPTPGWYLIGNTLLGAGEAGFAMVVDANGTPVWYRRSSKPVGIVDVDLLPNGSLSFTPFTTSDGAFETYELDPWNVKTVHGVDMAFDPHELQLLEDGNYVLIGVPITSGVDLTGLGAYGPNASLVDCKLQEIDPSGNVVWEWLASDHIDPVEESTAPAGTATVDAYHCNSIDVDSEGDLLLSARHTDAVFFIQKSTGKILWKLGGAAYSKDGAQLVRVDGDPEVAFYRQHDARFRPNGHVSLFDDHGVGTGPARGVEYALDFDTLSATVAWQYQGTVNSTAMGSFRRYDDGTNLIGWGIPSSGGLVFSEVDSFGHDLLDLSFQRPDASYRAIKVPLDALNVDALRATAGSP